MANVSAKEIIEKLIDEGRISGSEAITLLDAINSTEKPGYPTYPTNVPYTPIEPNFPGQFPWTAIYSNDINKEYMTITSDFK